MEEYPGINQKNNDCYVELIFNNKWNYIYPVRLFIQSLIYEHLVDHDISDKIALAASELVENAVKYNADGTNAHISLKIVHRIQDERLVLEVKNFSTEKNIETLSEEVDRIMREAPYQTYLKKVKELAGADREKSMLGLARVRYEAGCDLSLLVDSGVVTMRATFNL